MSSSDKDGDSYPPAFRRHGGRHVEPHAEEDDIERGGRSSDHIPLLDLNHLDLEELDWACKHWGLFRLVNHGVPPALVGRLFDDVKKLFSMSFELKQTLFSSPVSYFWGSPALTPSGDSISAASSRNNINWVEGFNFPQLQELQFEDDSFLASFRVVLQEYEKHQARLAVTVFEKMAKKLNLDSDHQRSEPHVSESTGLIRIYRYPSYLDEDGNGEPWGMNTHTDSSILSILNHDESCGLQVLKDDDWLNVKPISNTLIVNLGDMAQAISNDEYKSVKHRVKVNRQKRDKISICYFVFPGEETVVRSSNYSLFTYRDFQAQVQRDVKTLGYKVGLERFKKASHRQLD